MSDLLEGPIDDILDATDVGGPPQAPSLILVEYRNRGPSAPLVATLVVLIAGLAIMSYRRLTPPSRALGVRSAAGPNRAPVRPDARRPVAESSEVPSAQPAERVATPDPAPVIPPPLTADLTVTENSTTTDDAPAAPPAAHEAAVAEAALTASAIAPPPPDPGPSAEEVEREILRDAEERKAELEEMQRLKPEVRQAKERERPQRLWEERIAFRKELRAKVQAGGRDAGRRIAELCDQYGTQISDEHERIVNRYLRRSLTGPTLRDQVALLRALDVPEPAILEHVARYWNKRLRNARNGLRDADEVRVAAARHLLSMPLASRTVPGPP